LSRNWRPYSRRSNECAEVRSVLPTKIKNDTDQIPERSACFILALRKHVRIGSVRSWCPPNGLGAQPRAAREPTGNKTNPCASIVGLQRVLCRLRIWDFQVTTDLHDKKIVDL